jgi:Spy/CpxP family protein refolding chaperone
MPSKRLVAGLLAAAFAVALIAADAVFAHGDGIEDRDPGYGMGYGMEPDAMDQYCPGCGMTGGYGMGPGMMGGYGMGPGMTGAGPLVGLELTREQQKQMVRIETELGKHNWALQGKIIDARGELLELYADETPDPKKIGAVYGKIFDLRRQMIEAAIEAKNRQRAVLTEEQREKLRAGSYGGINGDYLRNYGGIGHRHGHQMMGQ